MNNWKKTTLGEIINFVNGYAFKSKDFLKEKIEDSMPIIKIRNVASGTVIFDGVNYHRYSDNYSKYIIQKGNILIAMTGNHPETKSQVVGEVALYKDDELSLMNQRVGKILPKENKVNNNFLYYFLKDDITHNKIAEKSAGSANQANISGSDIESLNINLPPLDEQKRIADVLSALDDKIEINNKINENLEAQAQAIFKQWFVDFEFPDEEGKPYKSNGGKFIDSELGKIPEGWKVGTLTQIASFLNGLAMQKFRPKEDEKGFPVLKIKELRQGCCDFSSDLCSERIDNNYIINNGDIIFSWSGTLMIDFWTGGICGLNQHLFKVESENYEDWFIFSWTKHHLDDFIRIAKDKAVTMGHIKREHLDKAKILIPTNEIYSDVTKILKPIFGSIINLRIENNNLSEIRDGLLPKLMSGEVRV